MADRIKQSFCYNLYLEKDGNLEELIGAAARIGFAAVELWNRENAPFEQICELADKYNLVVASFSGHNSLGDGLNKPENHDRIEEELLESIEVASKHGIPGLICFSGNRYEGRSDDECIDIVAEGLSRAKSAAQDANVNLNMELLNSKVNHPGYQCDHTAWGVEAVKKVGSPNVKLLYDIYHMQIMEGDLIRTIQENIDYIGHFHTAGNPGRNDMDDTQELNYKGICRGIAEAGYELYVGHEFMPKADKIKALEAAFKMCDV